MASGERWEDWAYREWHLPGAAACPPEWPFRSALRVLGRWWICLDRGGAIRFESGLPWVDLLHPEALVPYGEVVDAVLILSGEGP